jgi:glycosyltransferase involved in cell wall biosynthesis
MTDGTDGLVLQDPNDVAGLAARIRWLYDNPELRDRLAAQATVTASQFTWDRNGAEMRAIFSEKLNRKGRVEKQPPAYAKQEPPPGRS